MFKAIRIGHNQRKHPYMSVIPEGEIVTVAATKMNYSDILNRDLEYYHIKEYPTSPDGQDQWYAALGFAPISDIDEVAILEARVDQEMARLDEDWRQIVHKAETA